MARAMLLCALIWPAWSVAQAPAQRISAAAPSTAEAPPAFDLRETLVRVPVTVKDMNGRQETKAMAITMYRPPGEGLHPLLVFNHGRAVAAKRALQGLYRPEAAARYFVAKGFVVLVPTRVGYWETYGDFDPEATGSCSNPRLEPAAQAVTDQVLATVEYAKTLPWVDASRWIVAGQSAGGAASVLTVGKAPPGLLAGINFAGGTGGNPEQNPGKPCNPQAMARLWGELAKAAKAPMLWLYWPNDKYWGPDIPKTWQQAWLDGGGQAQMASFGPSGEDGHQGLNQDMDHWLPLVDQFLNQLGFTANAIVARPAPSGFADIEELAKAPLRPANQAAYQRFLELKLPRAFAVSQRGGFGWASGDYAVGRALGHCRKSGASCELYAVDKDVVWVNP
jgi:dienelactone hydrolase